MVIKDFDVNGNLFDVTLNEQHPTVVRAVELMGIEEVINVMHNSFVSLGLDYDNIEEMNRGGTWCVVTKAASVA